MASIFDSLYPLNNNSSLPTTTSNKVVVHHAFLLSPDGISPPVPLAGIPPKIPSPLDSNIQPGPGDDTSPPNSIPRDGDLNFVISREVANVGFSTSKQQENFTPSSISHTIRVVNCNGGRSQSMIHSVSLEFANPYADRGESMMIWVKKTKQYINDQVKKNRPLQLIDTVFQDFVDSRWVDITTTTRYTAEADAIVEAVVTTESGQTAGRVKSSGKDDDCKLGPVGSKGRVVLTFNCDSLYSYSEMSSAANAVLSNLVPIALFIPHAALDDECGAMEFSVKLEAPTGSVLLDSSENFAAFQELHRRQCFSNGIDILIPSGFAPGTYSFERAWSSLPVSKTAILFWLSIPDSGTALPTTTTSLLKASQKSSITIYEPIGEDAELQTVNLPGRTSGLLLRANVKTSASAKSSRDATCPRVFTNLLISDASGSTGMVSHRPTPATSFGGPRPVQGATVRDQFNALEILRIVNRLRTIPTLLEEGLIGGEDYWAEVAYVFDHTVLSCMHALFQVGDVSQHITSFCDYLMAPDTSYVATLQGQIRHNMGATNAFNSLKSLCEGIRKLSANGGTSFEVPAKEAVSQYAKFQQMVSEVVLKKDKAVKNIDFRAFVNFDTDGGHNGGSGYLSSIGSMVKTWHVVGGIVNGFGSWVDQHCASEVAAALKGPCQLCTEIPDAGSVGMNVHLLRDLSCWMKMIRFAPVKLQINAGSVSWKSRIGSRFENAMDVYAAKAIDDDEVSLLSFELPDVSLSTEFTSATISGANAGDSFDLYLLSRCGNATALKSRLYAMAGGEGMEVSVVAEHDVGVVLGYKWISLLSSAAGNAKTDIAVNRAVLPTTLVNGMLDSLSFNWNIPTLTGSTALLGRERTANRAPVAADHQPTEPKSDIATNISVATFGSTSSFLSGKTWAPAKGSYVKLCSSRSSSPPDFGSSVQLSFFGPQVHSLGFSPVAAASLPMSLGVPYGGFGGFGSTGLGSQSSASAGTKKSKRSLQWTNGDDDEESPTTTATSTFLTPQQILSGTEHLKLESNIHKVFVENNKEKSSLNSMDAFLHKLDALLTVSHRLQQDPYAVTAVNYFCDRCKSRIVAGAFRAHCMECFDVDMCESCYHSRAPIGQHGADHFEKMAEIGPGTISSRKGGIDPLISTVFNASSPSSVAAPTPAGGLMKLPMDIRNSRTYKVLKRILIRFILAVRDWGVLISAEFNSVARVVLDLSIAALAKDLKLVTAISSPTVSAQLAITDGVIVAKMTESFLGEIKKQLAR